MPRLPRISCAHPTSGQRGALAVLALLPVLGVAVPVLAATASRRCGQPQQLAQAARTTYQDTCTAGSRTTSRPRGTRPTVSPTVTRSATPGGSPTPTASAIASATASARPTATGTPRPTSAAPTASPSVTAAAPQPTATAPASSPPPPVVLGILQPSSAHLAAEQTAGVRAVTLEAGWDAFQPASDAWNADYARGLRDRWQAARDAGLQVVLDTGLQYPPAWVFSLPGGTRFVDQYGDVFHGDLGSDIANAVTDRAVRAAQGTYLTRLAATFPPGAFVAVRQGGLGNGEAHYPSGGYAGHTNAYWAFDTDTQASSSVPGWRPGTGTTDQAAAFLAGYDGALADYQAWLGAALRTGFATTNLLLLPSWGDRPGDPSAAAASRLDGSSPGEQRDTVQQGLDWELQVSRLAEPAATVLYTTWADSPYDGPGPVGENPAAYVAGLAATHGMTAGGENTGGGGPDALERLMARAQALDLRWVFWLGEPSLYSGGDNPTLADLTASARRHGLA